MLSWRDAAIISTIEILPIGMHAKYHHELLEDCLQNFEIDTGGPPGDALSRPAASTERCHPCGP